MFYGVRKDGDFSLFTLSLRAKICVRKEDIYDL